MYQNRISLIGFLGQNATTYTANNASFTVLSLATKSSYKDKKTGGPVQHLMHIGQSVGACGCESPRSHQ